MTTTIIARRQGLARTTAASARRRDSSSTWVGIIEVAGAGNEIGNQVKGAERVRDNAECEGLRVPRRPRVTAREEERERFRVDSSYPLFPRRERH